ncbi:cold-shock protein [Candidatus Omnitrophota bacterium]
MHRGKIKRLVRNRGFGFIDDTDGRQIFFHQDSLVEGSFDSLNEEQELEFEVERTGKGPCAFNVKAIPIKNLFY